MPLGKFQDRSSELPKDTPIICVQAALGRAAAPLCEQLTRQGFEDISNLSGGMIAWKRARLPFM